MDSVSGEVISKRRDGKGVKLPDGQWYSTFEPSVLSAYDRGASVDITYEQKGPFRNIKTIQASNGAAAPPAANGKDTHVVGPTKHIAKTFPMHPLSRDRTIIRSVALKAATDLQVQFGSTIEIGTVINNARELEAYVAGDIDKENAQKALGMVEEVPLTPM